MIFLSLAQKAVVGRSLRISSPLKALAIHVLVASPGLTLPSHRVFVFWTLESFEAFLCKEPRSHQPDFPLCNFVT